MLKKLFIVTVFLLLVTLQSFAQETEINPVKWSLEVEKPIKSLAKGDIFKVVLQAEIDQGWHLYALEKTAGGPIATRISTAENSPFELGKIESPPPLEVADSAFGVTTKFYENAVKFDLPFKVSDSFERDSSQLKIKIRFQVCNDEMCLPPTNLIVESSSGKQSKD